MVPGRLHFARTKQRVPTARSSEAGDQVRTTTTSRLGTALSLGAGRVTGPPVRIPSPLVAKIASLRLNTACAAGVLGTDYTPAPTMGESDQDLQTPITAATQ